MIIRNYSDFVAALLNAGFSMGGINSEDIYAVIPSYLDNRGCENSIIWHTGDPETDPWEWRMRVLNERDDIAYSKVFFRKSGYITKEWYPYFIAARRGGVDFKDAYLSGTISQYAKRIYDAISEHRCLPLYKIRECAGFGRDEKSQLECGLVELQMRMFITMCGRQQKVSQIGMEYGWPSTVFCTTESFFDDEVFDIAAGISEKEAVAKITNRIYTLNPNAEERKVFKFIKG